MNNYCVVSEKISDNTRKYSNSGDLNCHVHPKNSKIHKKQSKKYVFHQLLYVLYHKNYLYLNKVYERVFICLFQVFNEKFQDLRKNDKNMDYSISFVQIEWHFIID